MDESKSRIPPKSPRREPGAPGTRTPTKGESSSDSAGSAETVIGMPGLGGASKVSSDDSAATLLDAGANTAYRGGPLRSASGLFPSAAILRIGDVLAGRYEILELLGEGGMGAVYKAQDRELNRQVALKVIRPELAANPGILIRFKQELLLAHQVTHKNVIRIYDLGESGGVKFITMEFVQGVDLRSLLLAHGKFSPEEAAKMIRQVCLALEAAHGVGVIHRDLKPQNIMRDAHDRILVMDFGLARSFAPDAGGLTETGVLVGTMEYMSPEQAMGMPLDQRSDIFALGLIFFELLTAKSPYKAETALASLLKRNHERAVTAIEVDPIVPKGLSDIVSKCLEREVAQRYQNVQEVVSDLEAWEAKRPVMASNVPKKTWKADVRLKYLAIPVALIILAVAGWLLRGKVAPKSAEPVVAKGPATALAIIPFRNASGDASLDWLGSSVAEMLTTDIGQSATLRSVSPGRVHQILDDLRIPRNAQFDSATLHQIADSSNSDTLITGQYASFGDQIRIDATLQDLKHDRPPVPVRVEAANIKEVPAAIDRLAESVRTNLSLAPDVAKELKAQSFRPSSQSLDALRLYDAGLQSFRQGDNATASKNLQSAVKEDPDFALAYSKLGETYAALGHDTEGEQAAKRAEDLSSNLPTRERYLIIATHARLANDNQKAIEYYQKIAKASPEDAEIQLALGDMYDSIGNYDQAHDYYNRALQRDPQSPDALLAMGRMLTRRGDPQGGLKYLNTAYSLAVQGENNEAKKAASLYAMGLAYEQLNKLQDALRNFQDSLALRRTLGDQRGAASSLSELGNVTAQLGQGKLADASFQEALKIRRDIGDKRGLGATLLDYGNFVDDRGDHEQALQLYKESLQIQRDTNNESRQAAALNNIGSVYFSKGEYEDALTYFQQALQLREKAKAPADIVESINNVAETASMMGRYDQAIASYMRALELRRNMGDKRGAAIESYSIGTVFGYQGRFGAALNSKLDALKAFQELKDGTFWMAEILSGYGNALIVAGRGDEAKPYLDQALDLARQLKNNGLMAQVFNFQGDALFYKGDLKAARPLYERELQAASDAKEPDKLLIAKINLARQALREGHAPSALKSLRLLADEAERKGLKSRAIECSIYSAEALMKTKKPADARQELERSLLESEKLGLNPLSLQAHYLWATLLRESGNNAEAQEHYRRALRLLDAMAKDPGAEKILNRADLGNIASDSKHWLQGS